MGTVLWFTGLSGSGKTTIAKLLEKELHVRGKSVCTLDGDVVRATLHANLGFSRDDIRENNRLTAELAKQKSTDHDFVLVPIISPYREDRAVVRGIIGDGFVEVYVNCPLDVCIKKDVKGLYKKARAGKIENLIGVSSANPYEAPTAPDIEVKTDQHTSEECAGEVLRYLEERGLF